MRRWSPSCGRRLTEQNALPPSSQVFDRTFDCEETSTYPWCMPGPVDASPRRSSAEAARSLPDSTHQHEETPLDSSIIQTSAASPARPVPRARPVSAIFPRASRVRQDIQRHIKSIQALPTSLWHRFQERIDVLEKFGYLNAQAQLTADGGMGAADPHPDHSLLITELIRAGPSAPLIRPLLAAVMASIAH